MTLPRAVVSGILLVQGPSFLVKIFSAVSKAILLDITKILKTVLIESDSRILSMSFFIFSSCGVIKLWGWGHMNEMKKIKHKPLMKFLLHSLILREKHISRVGQTRISSLRVYE